MPEHSRWRKPNAMALLIGDVYECAAVLRAAGERMAAAEGQTHARFHALTVIADSPRSVPAIARRLGVSRQNLQRIANDLLREGLVEQIPNPDHRSSPLLRLTESGNETLERFARRADAYNRALNLTPSRVAQLRESLAELTDHARQITE